MIKIHRFRVDYENERTKNVKIRYKLMKNEGFRDFVERVVFEGVKKNKENKHFEDESTPVDVEKYTSKLFTSSSDVDILLYNRDMEYRWANKGVQLPRRRGGEL